MKRRIQDLPHARDWTVAEQPNAARRRIFEACDSDPSSQDSVARAVQNLSISDSPVAPAALPAPPPPTMRNARRPLLPKQKHQKLPPLCVVWPSCRRSRGVHRCLWHCQITTMSPVHLLRKRHSSPRTSCWGYLPGQATARASARSGQRYGSRSATPQGSQPVPPGEPLDDSPHPNSRIRDVVLTD